MIRERVDGQGGATGGSSKVGRRSASPPRQAIGLLGRVTVFLGCAIGMGFAASGGCTQVDSSTESQAPPAVDEPVGEAKQAAVSAQACLAIRRSGATGTVFDTQIANKLPPKNYGTSGTMNAGSLSGEERQTLMQFDLSAIPSGPNTNITNANISLAQGAATTGPGTITVHNVLAPWNETSVTWQSFGGAFDPMVLTSFSNSGSFVNFNIYQLVDDWVHGVTPNYGILLKQAGPNMTNFWSSDYLSFHFRPQLYVCWTVTCDPGYADCNVNGFDGCEVDTTTNPAHCGACGQACSLPNATPTCVASTCQIGSCNLGWGDCDGLATNGCETMLTTNSDCGACGVACAAPNGVASCATGTCTLTACNAGFFNCDGDGTNGCEPLPCGNGQQCSTNSDCASFVCIGGFCAAPSCVDVTKNGSETDVDCGGGACPPCANGQTCIGASDCSSSVCTGGICQAPTCTDGVKNASETDVDCGGGTCPDCAVGQGCGVNYDCQSGVCIGGFCQAAACNDGVLNGNETGVDCGGSCAPCAVSIGCATGSDCTSSVCSNGVCQIPSCSDGVMNGSETGVDCGGFCAPCYLFQPCVVSGDCQAGDSCVNGYCQAPTCTNGVRDGNETGIDCGGSCFRPETCNGADDDCSGTTDDGLGSVICGIGACQVIVPACNAGNPAACTPGTPTAEVCGDGLDNNCDGVIDEGCPCSNGATQACYTGSAATMGIGACHAGTQTCMHGQWGACVGQATPNAESCDGVDNDCNGFSDDGLGTTSCGAGSCTQTTQNCVGGMVQTCTPRAAQPETCDNADNDCNGEIDDDLPPITCGVGACQVTVPSCVNGQANICTPGNPTPEVCDGIDNDCNGVVDNGVLPTWYADADGDGYGNPSSSVQSCTQPAGYVANNTDCNDNAASAHPGGTEVCDGLDNNCNGQTDESLGSTTCGVGACQVTVQNCVGGVPQTCNPGTPTPEVCDGIDNNCNGQVDDGLGSTTCGSAGCQVTVQNCVGGVPQTCNAAVVNGQSCSDGNACTQTDTCQNGTCVGANPVICTASDQCHNAGTCNPSTGVCSNPAKPNGTACSDANACTTGDTCQAGVCTGGAAPNCNDNNPCTVDSCNPATGCVNTPGNAGTVCRASAGPCDVAETCNGSSAACPADGFASSATVCRASAGPCDVAESCTGSSAACPGDSFLPSSTVCRAAVAGGCDVAESCTGSSAACPADVVVAAGTVCRASAGACDVAETCNGSSNTCPADAFAPSSTVCRASAGVCDSAESCTGSSATCPADAKVAAGTVCRASSGVCDVAETCNGSANTCPADGFVSAGTTCRAAAGPCDVAEACTGASAACPGDSFAPPSTVCRASAGVCDLQENCTGASAACPGDAKVAAGTVCRGSAGVCDVAETCNGSANTCPADGFVAAGTVCRASTGQCDVADACTGSAAACPADAKATNGTSCNDGNGCTINDACSNGVCVGSNGAGGACTTGQAGVCSAGTIQCVSNSLQCVSNTGASTDICDNLDNDCNGNADNDLDEGYGNTCGGAQVVSVSQGTSVTMTGKGGTDYITFRFDGMQGLGGWFFPRITLTNNAGGQYVMNVMSAGCAGSFCGNISDWQMSFPADPNGCTGAFGGYTCSDFTGRPSEVVVQVTRVSGSAPNQYYTLVASNCNGACGANYATSTNTFPDGDQHSNTCGGSVPYDVLPGQSYDIQGHVPNGGGSDFIVVQFQNVPGVSGYFHPKIDLIDTVGGQYRINVQSAGCAGSYCGNITTFEQLFPNNPNGCNFDFGGFTCSDATARVTYAVVQVIRVAGGGSCQNYRLRISNQ